MFWRFGFHNASSIDTLLDRDDVALEDILDEDDLLQECKAQNTRLIDYFQRLDVLHRLFGYVTGAIEGEDKGRFKYPYVATEVLCSEIWSIVEACVTNSEQLLTPFWENVLERSQDELRTRMAMATHFAKINGVFMTKKPAEMLDFIQSHPLVVERIIRHIETPAIVDLLFRIIQLDEHPSGAGVLEWLTSNKLIPRLVDLLSPTQLPEKHLVVAEVIKGIITMSAPSPGASALNDGLQHVPASNRFARELASRENISKLLHFMLDEVPLNRHITSNGIEANIPEKIPLPETRPASPEGPMNNPENHYMTPMLPNAESATSSVVNSISIIIELIRKNNSDYFEPYLFHNLRNRLIQVQQHLHMQSEDGRDVLERAMKELVDRMGVVHLGTMLELMCDRLDGFQALLNQPRTPHGPVLTTIGAITPLTIERFRICELYAELLHCSNMALLNRASGTGPAYDQDGRLLGGLSALEELARVISIGNGDTRDTEAGNGYVQEMVEAKELPVRSTNLSKSTDSSSLASDSDSDLSDHSSDEALEEIAVNDSSDTPFPIRYPSRDHSPLRLPSSRESSPLRMPSSQDNSPLAVPSSPDHTLLSHSPELTSLNVVENAKSSNPGEPTVRQGNSRNGTEDPSGCPVGDLLKQRFMDNNVVSTLLDFFFQFPWNNFLHGTVYDLVHQILTGRVDSGLNRNLVITLFRDARLLHRIVEGHEENHVRSKSPKGVRLGYMGHLTLISEDVISALGHYPEDLTKTLEKYAPQPAWDQYVNGGYQETKKRDTSLLGGGKPVVAPGTGFPKGRWAKVDEEDTGGFNGLGRDPNKVDGMGGAVTTSGISSEFRRIGASSSAPTNTADFGRNQDHDDEEPTGPTQFARYLAEEIHATPASQFTNSGSSSDASDDDEDDDGGWLARSSPFDLEQPASVARSLQEAASSGFDDAFTPSASMRSVGSANFDISDPFDPSISARPSRSSFDTFTVDSDEDDAFGPFSDAAAPSDRFIFSSDPDDSPFDFGDFQAAEAPSDGEITPTAGSWTFEGSESSSPLSGSGLSFGGSSEEAQELREGLEASCLEDQNDEARYHHEASAQAMGQ